MKSQRPISSAALPHPVAQVSYTHFLHPKFHLCKMRALGEISPSLLVPILGLLHKAKEYSLAIPGHSFLYWSRYLIGVKFLV